MKSSAAILIILAAGTLVSIWPFGGGNDSGDELLFTVWGMPFEDRLFLDRYALEFERLHPNIRFDYQRYQDVTEKYFAWHLVGEGADVMRVRITDYHTFIQRGMLEPLDEFLDDPELGLSESEQHDFLPYIWDLLHVDGSVYALPSDNAQYGLYFNKRLFDEYNAVHPGDPLPFPSAEWTWDDLREAATKLTTTDVSGRVVQYGIDFDLWAWPFMTFFRQAGGELWDAEQATTLIDTEPGIEALEVIVELLPHTASMRSLSVVGSASGPDKLFAGGQTAMMLDGSWRAPDLERVNPDLDFAIAPLPRGERRAVVSGSVVWAISAHSEHKEDAWRFIRWMSQREQMHAYWDLLRVAPPARSSVIRSDEFKETGGLRDGGVTLVPPMPRELYADRAAWLEHGITPDPPTFDTGIMPAFVPVAPYQKDLEDAIEAMLKQAINPNRTQSLQQLLDRAAASVHQIIDRDRAARGLPAVER